MKFHVGQGEAPAEPLRRKLGRSVALPIDFQFIWRFW